MTGGFPATRECTPALALRESAARCYSICAITTDGGGDFIIPNQDGNGLHGGPGCFIVGC
jgi:hypothetical protein